MINSIENPKIKFLLKLTKGKYRRIEQKFLVEGPHLVSEAQKAGLLIEAFSIEDKPGYTRIDSKIMRSLCNTDTVVKEIGLCEFISKTDVCDHILILDGIQDPGNMGSIMRSACAFGFSTIFLGEGCVDIYNDKVIRSSQGAIFKLNFIAGDTVSFIKSLTDYKVYGTNVIRGISLESIPNEKKVAIILGNEGNGISKEVNELNLDNIFIKMQNTESLNVAIAASIIMYKFSL